jgi:hypothetical protein
MIDRAWGEKFARNWIDAWNAHDLDLVLKHYVADFEMVSPLIVQRMGISEGRLKGKEAVGAYWSHGLATTPNLHFKLLDVMIGVSSIGIVYESVTSSRTVVEIIEFNQQQLGVRSQALYGPAQ